jgi:Cytochrome P450
MTIAAPKKTENIFDPLMFVPNGVMENPYPRLNSMRELGPILRSPNGNQWLVCGYEEANAILRSNQLGKRLDRWRHPNFLMRTAYKIFRKQGVSSILLQDPPAHTRVRSLVNSTFTPRMVHALEEHITTITDNLLDEMLKNDSFDLIADFAFPLPVTVIAELLGIPASDRMRFKEWSTKITSGLEASKCPMRLVNSFWAMNELRGYLNNAINIKRKSPEQDLISLLVEAQAENNDKLSQEELLANAVLILIAGHETTVNLIANGVCNLLAHPDQKQLMLDDPGTISGAVEEILRYDPPVQIVRRMSNQPFDIGGFHIPPGDAITILIGACNRDPRINKDPERFDILRKDIRHLTFGAGIHYCLGAELARTEARIAFRRLFNRVPGLRIKSSPIHYKGPFALRGPKELFATAE